MRYQFLRRNLLTLILSLISFYLVILVFKKSQGEVYLLQRNETSLFLDNILDKEYLIEQNKGIFFIDTTRMKKPWKQRRLTIRQICAIESAALSNPNNKVFVILASPRDLKAIELTKDFEAILSNYPNIIPLSLNLIQFSIDTPLENFIANGNQLFNSIFIKSHTSDALRLLLLYKYGGTYIDTDMIVRQELSDLPHNFICKDHNFLNGAIINLDTRRGKEFNELFIKDMIDNFNGTAWGTNGPLMLQRVLGRICGTEIVKEMHDCDGFNLLPDEFCYPVKGLSWLWYFQEIHTDSVMRHVEDSYVVHFWNKLSEKELLKCNSNAAYTKLAREYCPVTMSTCKDYF